MKLSSFISKRITRGQKESFSSTIHTIAVASIAIGLGFSIVAFLIMKGFQETVKGKIYGFSGHIIVTKFSTNNSPEEQPMDFNIDLYNYYDQFPGVTHIQEYAHKAGLVKTDDEVLGIVLKGVGLSFDQERFRESIVEGEFPSLPDSGYSNQIMLSRVIADKLNAKVGDDVIVHFFQNPPRLRKLSVSGIYETNLSEYFDSKIVIGDIRMIQRLNDWADSIAGGLEVYITDPNKMDEVSAQIGEAIDYDLDIQPVDVEYSQVFEWLNLLSRQVNILLVIILTVVCVNMISIVLILVMERTQMIGLLKALGARDGTIRSIFMHGGINLLIKGLLYGNLLGLGLCFLQDHFKVVKLNPHDYYMDFVPISWNWEIVIVLNVLTFSIVSLVLLVPTMAISKINPIKAIKFD